MRKEPSKPGRRSPAPSAEPDIQEILGESRQASVLRATIRLLAGYDCSVIVYGENGTGKELVARALHKNGARAGGPFVALNCAAIPESMLEAELFGYVRGAFTGALKARPGVLEQANGGTLFLDEVGDASLALQARLLRVLQEHEVVRLGSDKVAEPIPLNVRVIAATNKDLEVEIGSASFREDLYFRLNEELIEVPSLRERVGDTMVLARHFREQYQEELRISPRGTEPLFSPEARSISETYRWPGNVRELRSVMRAAVRRTRHRCIDVEHLPRQLRRPGQHRQQANAPEPRAVGKTADKKADEQHRRGVVPEPGRPANLEPSDAVLAFIRKHAPTKAATVRAALDLTKSTCHRLLAGLESAGRVRRVGTGLKTKYMAVDEANGDQEPDEQTAGPPAPPADAVTEMVAALTDRQASILQVLATAPAMSVGELRAELADPPSLRTLRADLLRLKQAGLVNVEGAGPRTRWLLIRRP